MTLFVCWAVPRQHCAWFSWNARIATVTTFSFGWVVRKRHTSQLQTHLVTMCLRKPIAPLSPPLPGFISTPRFPPPSFQFYLTSSNYFRVIPASHREKRHRETKPNAPPTDPSATQLQPGMGLYVANWVAAAIASGSNRARRGCLLSEGRGCVYVTTQKLKYFERLNEHTFMC